MNLDNSWYEALAYCKNNLSVVLNSNTNQMLADTLQDQHLQEAWIGLYRGAWKWVDSTSSSFRQWAPNEPDNKNNMEGCAGMYGGRWYDWRCDQRMSFLCQST